MVTLSKHPVQAWRMGPKESHTLSHYHSNKCGVAVAFLESLTLSVNLQNHQDFWRRACFIRTVTIYKV